MSGSIIYREPAPGSWVEPTDINPEVYGAGPDTDTVYPEHAAETRPAACRYTWERWALGVLGPAVEDERCEAGMGWRQNVANDSRTVEFGGGIIIICHSGGYWLHAEPANYTDPVAALAAAALESIRRRL